MNEYTAMVEADVALVFEADDEADARQKLENTRTGQLGPPHVVGLEGPDVESESNHVASLSVNEVNIYEVRDGYEVVVDMKNSDDDLVVYQSPKDPLWEQLMKYGLITVEQ